MRAQHFSICNWTSNWSFSQAARRFFFFLAVQFLVSLSFLQQNYFNVDYRRNRNTVNRNARIQIGKEMRECLLRREKVHIIPRLWLYPIFRDDGTSMSWTALYRVPHKKPQLCDCAVEHMLKLAWHRDDHRINWANEKWHYSRCVCSRAVISIVSQYYMCTTWAGFFFVRFAREKRIHDKWRFNVYFYLANGHLLA